MKVKDVDVFILDDGMQHFDVHRDFEITVFDGTKPLWHYKLLPMGFAREGLSAVRRADFAVFTRANFADEDELDRLEQKVFRAGVMDATEASLELTGVENLVGAGAIEIQNSKVFLACGIGSPESFRALVKGGGALIVGMHQFRDHNNFTLDELRSVAKEASQKQAQYLLITEKDAVKWHELWRKQPFEWPLPVGVVKTALTFSPPMIDVIDAIAHGQH
jgi:tetraacyldisaccharide 4'-kinase